MTRLPVFFAMLLALSGLALAESQPAPLGEKQVTVDYRDGTYFASLSLRVAAAPKVAFAVLTDFEHMAEFVPNLKSSQLLSRHGNVYRIRQQGEARFGPFSFPFESERRVEWFPSGVLMAQGLSGSSKMMRSELRLQDEGGVTQIDYRLEVIPDRWLPSTIGIGFMRHELAEQFSAIAREIERRQAGSGER